MDRQYSESFIIPTGGWTGGAQAIMNAATTGAVQFNAKLWRDSAGVTMSVAAGQIMPLKAKFINYASGGPLVGLN